jgi:putative endonuclease
MAIAFRGRGNDPSAPPNLHSPLSSRPKRSVAEGPLPRPCMAIAFRDRGKDPSAPPNPPLRYGLSSGREDKGGEGLHRLDEGSAIICRYHRKVLKSIPIKTVNLNKYWVYITTNQHRTVRYIGVTNDLQRRLQEHKDTEFDQSTFTGRYRAYHLIYFEEFTDITQAINREKQLKRWSRVKKDTLIALQNPMLEFLSIGF